MESKESETQMKNSLYALALTASLAGSTTGCKTTVDQAHINPLGKGKFDLLVQAYQHQQTNTAPAQITGQTYAFSPEHLATYGDFPRATFTAINIASDTSTNNPYW